MDELIEEFINEKLVINMSGYFNDCSQVKELNKIFKSYEPLLGKIDIPHYIDNEWVYIFCDETGVNACRIDVEYLKNRKHMTIDEFLSYNTKINITENEIMNLFYG